MKEVVTMEKNRKEEKEMSLEEARKLGYLDVEERDDVDEKEIEDWGLKGEILSSDFMSE